MATATTEKESASLESVFESIDKRAENHEEAYRQFVFDLVEGKAKVTKDTEAYVFRTGRTLDVLRADLATCKARTEAVAKAGQAEAIRLKENDLRKVFRKAFDEAEAFEAELKRQVKARWDKVDAIREQGKSLDFEYRELGEVSNKVIQQTYDPAIDDELQTKEATIANLRRQLAPVNEEINQHLRHIDLHRRNHREADGRSLSQEELVSRFPGDVPKHLSHRKTMIEKQITDTENAIASLKAAKFDVKRMKWAPKK